MIGGDEHREARIAESVIGGVLLVGAALTFIRPRWARAAGLAAQAFALLGTAVGILTIVIGVGPRTIADLVYHVGIVILLVAGLVKLARGRFSETRRG